MTQQRYFNRGNFHHNHNRNHNHTFPYRPTNYPRMSSLLALIDPSDDELSYDDDDYDNDDFVDENNGDDDEELNDGGDENVDEAEQVPVTHLPIMSAAERRKAAKKAKKTATPAKKQEGKQQGKQQKQQKQSQKKFTLDDVDRDDIDSKGNIKYGDVSEKEYYDNLLLTEEERLKLSRKMKTLDNLSFRLPVRESVMMSFDHATVSSVTIVRTNPEWVEAYRSLNLHSINRERKQCA